MKRTNLFHIGIIIILGVAAYFGNLQVQSHLGAKARQETGLETHALEEALTASARSKKPILVEVSAVWCPSCRALDKKVLSNPGVRQRINSDFLFVRLEFESPEGEAFMKRQSLTGFPQIVLINTDQTLAKNLPVTFDPEKFLGLLR